MKYTVIERIRFIIKKETNSITKFSEATNIPYGTIKSVLSKGINPSYDFLSKLIETYPKYSANWILTGEGDYLIPKPLSEESQKNRDLKQKDETGRYNVVALIKINEKCYSAFSLEELGNTLTLLDNSIEIIRRK